MKTLNSTKIMSALARSIDVVLKQNPLLNGPVFKNMLISNFQLELGKITSDAYIPIPDEVLPSIQIKVHGDEAVKIDSIEAVSNGDVIFSARCVRQSNLPGAKEAILMFFLKPGNQNRPVSDQEILKATLCKERWHCSVMTSLYNLAKWPFIVKDGQTYTFIAKRVEWTRPQH